MDLYDKDYMMDVKYQVNEAKSSEQDVKEAIGKILADKTAYSKSLNYAVNYCKAAMDMSGHELSVQCLYILNNLAAWRHPDAKEVRNVLKAFKE